ncbi:MAG TPA: bifunctional (p)ppGpp synthetase/guanosine-3',5'-bis(diphosphate) 3'-pyrophosphohydrolase [Burkholderiales bacterium]|nr:bifunctional (p)ppGpp synthetase/guanosine-3',5'-bis(diphosphate) 3'-pyrophosphohydrolase [Burkholderiales bacterium]
MNLWQRVLAPRTEQTDLPFKEPPAYLKPADIEQLRLAYEFSRTAHEGQFRKTGDPYISHPLAVTDILSQWHLDAQALTAALLHDVIEDTEVSKAEISRKFGKHVAELVDGVSKLDRIEFESQEVAQAESFRKMLLAMARDVRVMLIKLADRLHNMRTLDAMPEDKRRRIARETSEIYAPIAKRLGLSGVYHELEDLSLRQLHPTRYLVLDKAMKSARGNRREVVGKILNSIKRRLHQAAIEAAVSGREKHLYSVYQKMREKRLSFSDVLDIHGFRILVRDVPSCYLALGALHGLYKPIPGKFKDYVAIPKVNGYQSLHTTVFGPFGTPIEVQIRTHDMHKIAESGVAAHWLYKGSRSDLSDLQQNTHQWLQSLLEIQSESGDSIEFLENLKVDLFPDEVYVFTPKGEIKALPRGATAVDFAYAVHTDIGNRCVAVKINDDLMPLRTELKTGDRVEIITAALIGPNPAWLNYVVTGKARSHIRHFLKTMQFDQSVKLGERLLEQALDALKLDLKSVKKGQWEKLVRESGVKSRDELLADIGLGKRLAIVVARRLLPPQDQSRQEGQLKGAITIRGLEGMAVQFGKCCGPIPGDPIVGFINKGQGMLIHTHDCPTIGKAKGDSEKWLDVEWDHDTSRLFSVNVRMVVANQKGVLARVAGAIAEANSNISNVSMEADDASAYTTMYFTLQVLNRMHLASVMRGLRKLPSVVRISRVKT